MSDIQAGQLRLCYDAIKNAPFLALILGPPRKIHMLSSDPIKFEWDALCFDSGEIEQLSDYCLKGSELVTK